MYFYFSPSSDINTTPKPFLPAQQRPQVCVLYHLQSKKNLWVDIFTDEEMSWGGIHTLGSRLFFGSLEHSVLICTMTLAFPSQNVDSGQDVRRLPCVSQ